MPIERLHILCVYERDTRIGTKYDVFPVLEPGADYAPVFSTFDPFAASLCQRAKVIGKPVDLTWKDGRYGRELVTVQLADQAVA